jgi:hypothetical protein
MSLLVLFSGADGGGGPVGPAYGLDDNTTMMAFYIADTLLALPGHLNEDVRSYYDDVTGTTGNSDLNSAVWTDLKN